MEDKPIEPRDMIVFATVSSVDGVVKRDFSKPSVRELHEANLVILYTETDSVYVWKDRFYDRTQRQMISQEWAELLVQAHVQKCKDPPKSGRI